MYGFQVYSTEVDDRGIDFIARYDKGEWLQIQVKSARTANTNYIFLSKDKFELSPSIFVVLVLFDELKPPQAAQFFFCKIVGR